MSQTPLAFCDNPDPKRRHVLAMLIEAHELNRGDL